VLRKPRLPAPADAGERDESVLVEEFSDEGDLVLPSDECGTLEGEVVPERLE
jgi:hypothetical protein